MTFERMQEFNTSIKMWGNETRNKFLMKMASMQLNKGIEIRTHARKEIKKMKLGKENTGHMLSQRLGSDTLYESLRVKYKSSGGEIYFISFPFARHGIFVVKGVSRGHKVSSPREKKDWITPVLQVQTALLASMIADKYADVVGNETLKVLAGREVVKM